MKEFEYERLEHVSKALIDELASCDLISNRLNIVMIGNSGSGKTHLSIAQGMKDCYLGFNVRFFIAMNLANELSVALQTHRLLKLKKSLTKINLLIIDELSYLTFNRHQAEMFFQVISESSERSSVIIITNREFSRGTELFENELLIATLIDRITFRSHILNMNVKESYRFIQSLQRENTNGKKTKIK